VDFSYTGKAGTAVRMTERGRIKTEEKIAELNIEIKK
jgi:hypothetical protein